MALATSAPEVARATILVDDDTPGNLEARDSETGYHIVRTQFYLEALGRQLLRDGRHLEALQGGRLERIMRAAPLHDIGKFGTELARAIEAFDYDRAGTLISTLLDELDLGAGRR